MAFLHISSHNTKSRCFTSRTSWRVIGAKRSSLSPHVPPCMGIGVEFLLCQRAQSSCFEHNRRVATLADIRAASSAYTCHPFIFEQTTTNLSQEPDGVIEPDCTPEPATEYGEDFDGNQDFCGSSGDGSSSSPRSRSAVMFERVT